MVLAVAAAAVVAADEAGEVAEAERAAEKRAKSEKAQTLILSATAEGALADTLGVVFQAAQQRAA